MRKKIIMAVSRGSIARNLLQNDFYKLLAEEFDVLLLTQGWNDERFVREFSRPNVRMEPLGEDPHTWGDRVIFFFHKYLIYNEMTEFMSRFGIIGDPRAPKAAYPVHIIRKALFLPLSKLKLLRDIVRRIDRAFLQRDEVARFRALYQRERPDAVIVTNITDDLEAAMLKAATLEGVFSLGMPKTWDNLSTHGFRAKADMLIVWSEFMMEQAIRYQNYTEETVRMIGIPQFDYYKDPRTFWAREEFCNRYGLDPKRKILLFGSEGKLVPTDADIARILASLVGEGELRDSCQLLLRPHYAYKGDEQKFTPLLGRPHVAVDTGYAPSEPFRDRWDYSREFMERFANTLYHADICINTASTLTLDASAFDKPIVSIAFDGFRNLPPDLSVARWYDPDYYREVLKMHATEVVRSEAKLSDAVRSYLEHPEKKRAERAALVRRFCGPVDGRAGRRFFEVVKKLTDNR